MILLCWITNIQVLKSCFPGFTGFMNFSDAFYEVAAISAHFTQTSLSWEEQVLPITTLYAFIYRDRYPSAHTSSLISLIGAPQEVVFRPQRFT